MFQTQQGVEEAKNSMYMDCLFVCLFVLLEGLLPATTLQA
jgi:hypothetical protein